MTLQEHIKEEFDKAPDKRIFINELREYIATLSPFKHPVDVVKWLPIDKVSPNDYNPNAVAKNEMRLLHTSVDHDGYTQPIVTVYDKTQDIYVIVDGFHRYLIARHYQDIAERTNGCVPCVVIEKDINDRMASTIRHNRARGKHSMEGMSNMVFEMLQNKWKDEDICNELGLEPDELLRLKHITGFSKLFEGIEYGKAWETDQQMKLRRDYEQRTRTENAPTKQS